MFFFLLFGLFGLSNLSIFAIDEFTLTKDIFYHFDLNGQAAVEETVQLRNNLSQIYPTQYTLTLTGAGISQVTGHDNYGNIVKDTTQTKDGQSTTINLNFNHPAVGKGQVTTFTILYRAKGLAKPKGNTWEITLPPKETSVILNSLKISVPNQFGPVAFASVAQTSQEGIVSRLISLTPAKDDKILITFGDYQLFDFHLTHEIPNQQASPGFIKIPIPPDTGSQRVIFSNFSPRPKNITSDPDGNWLANYDLSPSSQTTIRISGQVETFPATHPTAAPLPQHTQSQSIWPISDPQIITTAANLKNPKAIYDYVISHLTYNYDLIKTPQRRGALAALNDPANSLCTEFTDLFVALARAKGIPSREVEGFALTNDPKIKPVNPNSDILHAWPQYYDKIRQSWVDIDPTWGKTTNGVDYFSDLDLNHLTFVIHGLDSHNPPSPGSYRLSQDKTIDVSLSTVRVTPSNLPPTIDFDPSSSLPRLLLKNPNLHALKSVIVATSNWSWQTDSLPPLSTTPLTPKNPLSPKLNLSLSYHNQTLNLRLNLPRRSFFSWLTNAIIQLFANHDQKNP